MKETPFEDYNRLNDEGCTMKAEKEEKKYWYYFWKTVHGHLSILKISRAA